jgi:hypothetical protein
LKVPGRAIRLAALACAALGAAATRAAEPAIEQLVGGIDAVVFVCNGIDPKSAKKGQELLQRTVAQHKLDLAAVRASENHRSIYDPEVNRLLSLPAKERLSACQTAW